MAQMVHIKKKGRAYLLRHITIIDDVLLIEYDTYRYCTFYCWTIGNPKKRKTLHALHSYKKRGLQIGLCLLFLMQYLIRFI